MEERINKLEKKVDKLEDEFHNVDKSTSILDQKLDSIIDSINKLTDAIKENQLEQKEKIAKLEIRVDALKEELEEKTVGADAKKWGLIISGIITGVVAFLLGLLLK